MDITAIYLGGSTHQVIVFMYAFSVQQPHPKVLLWHLHHPTHGRVAALSAVSTTVNDIVTKLSAAAVQTNKGANVAKLNIEIKIM